MAVKKATVKSSAAVASNDAPRMYEDAKACAAWLEANHATANGVWVRIAKKASGIASVQYPQVLDVAIAFE